MVGCFWNVHNHASSLQDGWSSLMRACSNGNAKVVRILVLAGANVNDQSKVSTTSPPQLPLVTCTLIEAVLSGGDYNYDQGRGRWEGEMGGGSAGG